MKDRSNDPSHHERMLLPQSYISLLYLEMHKDCKTHNNWVTHIKQLVESLDYVICLVVSFVADVTICLKDIFLHDVHSTF